MSLHFWNFSPKYIIHHITIWLAICASYPGQTASTPENTINTLHTSTASINTNIPTQTSQVYGSLARSAVVGEFPFSNSTLTASSIKSTSSDVAAMSNGTPYLYYPDSGLYSHDPNPKLTIIFEVLSVGFLISILSLPAIVARFRTKHMKHRWSFSQYSKEEKRNERIEKFSVMGFENLDTVHSSSNWRCKVRGIATVFFCFLESSVWEGIVDMKWFNAIILISGCSLFAYSIACTPSPGPGWLATTLIPLAVSTANRNSIFSLIAGSGHDKVHFVHRVTGYFFALAFLLHSVPYLVFWIQHSLVAEKLRGMQAIGATVAFVGVFYITFFSIPYFRSLMYFLFLYMHIIGIVLLHVGTLLHWRPTYPYMIVSLGLYFLSICLQLFRTRNTYAYLIPAGKGITRVTIPEIKSGWNSGQLVWLKIRKPFPSFEVSRPFTIANSHNSRGLRLFISSVGPFTTHLSTLASSYTSSVNVSDVEKSFSDEGIRVDITLEGPHESVGCRNFAVSSSAFFVAGGSGVSYMLSMAEDLLYLKMQGQAPRLRYLKLLWVTRDVTAVSAIGCLLTDYAQRCQSLQQAGLILDIQVHITGGKIAADTYLDLKGVTIKFNRPNIVSAIAQVYTFTKDLSVYDGITVGVCGPPGIRKATLNAICCIPLVERVNIGGYQLYSETI